MSRFKHREKKGEILKSNTSTACMQSFMRQTDDCTLDPPEASGQSPRRRTWSRVGSSEAHQASCFESIDKQSHGLDIALLSFRLQPFSCHESLQITVTRQSVLSFLCWPQREQRSCFPKGSDLDQSCQLSLPKFEKCRNWGTVSEVMGLRDERELGSR